jgi:hypothetical protein
MQNMPVSQTVIAAAQDTLHVKAFNYASEALNNSFFLSSLVSSGFDMQLPFYIALDIVLTCLLHSVQHQQTRPRTKTKSLLNWAKLSMQTLVASNN